MTWLELFFSAVLVVFLCTSVNRFRSAVDKTQSGIKSNKRATADTNVTLRVGETRLVSDADGSNRTDTITRRNECTYIINGFVLRTQSPSQQVVFARDGNIYVGQHSYHVYENEWITRTAYDSGFRQWQEHRELDKNASQIPIFQAPIKRRR